MAERKDMFSENDCQALATGYRVGSTVFYREHWDQVGIQDSALHEGEGNSKRIHIWQTDGRTHAHLSEYQAAVQMYKLQGSFFKFQA